MTAHESPADFPKYGKTVGPFRLNKEYYAKFTLGLTDDEKKKVNQTDLFKKLLDNSNITVKKPLSDEEVKIFKEMILIKNNINQISRSLNSFKRRDILNKLEVEIANSRISTFNNILDKVLNKF